MNAAEYEELQEQVSRAQSKADQAVGRLETLLKELYLKFKVRTVADAEKLLRRMEKEEQGLRDQYETAHAKFIRDWKDVLND